MDATATDAAHTATSHAAQPAAAQWRAWRSHAWARVRDRRARGWYFGAAFGLLYQVLMVVSIWTTPHSLWLKILASVMLVPYYAGFMLLPPMTWSSPRMVRLTVIGAYWAYTLLFLPIIGSDIVWLWLLVAAVVATLCEEFVLVASIVAVLVAVPLIYGVITDFRDSAAISAPISFSIAAMMYGINIQLKAMRELRAAQGEVARLAVVEERARFSRDMHDGLGHSLTVVTVKSELARKLVSRDPTRAEEEIADIERLTRAALSDLRSAVTGYREMSLSTELAVAQAALAAAEIQAHLPRSGDPAAAELQEVFGWVLREGVTNVIRHSGARNCWVELTRSSLTICDDGRGDDGRGMVPRGVEAWGNGLHGLAERAREAGAKLSAGTDSHGGFRLVIERGRA